MTRQEAVSFLVKYPEKFGRMVGFTKLSKIHRTWMREMLSGKADATLQAHRGSYKTTCVSIVLALIVVLLPNVRTLFVRKTDGDVKEIIAQVKKILRTPQMVYFVQVIYGVNLRFTLDNAFEVRTNLTTDTKGTAQLLGIGSQASITGKHFDLIFTDDIVNIQDRASRAERDRVINYYYELQNIKNPGGRIFNTGTPWHPNDAFTVMPEAERWDCYSTGIMSEDEIQQKRDSMSPSWFAANYLLKHIADDKMIFLDPVTGADPALAQQGLGHIDAAYGGEDFTAFTIMRNAGGKHYVLGKLWQKAVDECEDEIIRLRQQFLCGKIYCEDNADKGYLAKDLRKKGERVSTYTEHQNKYIKIVTFLKGEWQNVVFVAGTDEEYINQICDYNEEAEHDDAPDSLASLIRQTKNKETETGGYKSIFGGVY